MMMNSTTMNTVVLPTFRRSAFRRLPRSLQAPWGPGMPGTLFVLRGDEYDVNIQDASPLTTGRAALVKRRRKKTTSTWRCTARTAVSTVAGCATRLRQPLTAARIAQREPGPVEGTPQTNPHHLDRQIGRCRGLGRSRDGGPFGVTGHVGRTTSSQRKGIKVHVFFTSNKKKKKKNACVIPTSERRVGPLC